MNIKRSFTCESSNLIYEISCSVCHAKYIGETGRTLGVRFKEHLADTLHARAKPVALHFNGPGHSAANMSVRGLWQMRGTTMDRRDMESHLIDRLGTLKPAGMNEKP